MNNFPNRTQLINGKFWFHLFIFHLGQGNFSGKNVVCGAPEKNKKDNEKRQLHSLWRKASEWEPQGQHSFSSHLQTQGALPSSVSPGPSATQEEFLLSFHNTELQWISWWCHGQEEAAPEVAFMGTFLEALFRGLQGFWTVVLEKTRESFGLQGDPTSQC